jgi:hypothetical protein
MGADEIPFRCNFILKFEFGDLERSWSTGEDLETEICGYSGCHEDDLR